MPSEARRFNARPTDGHPSQRLAILALHDEGLDPNDIATRLSVHVNVVRARISEDEGGARTGRSKPMNGHPSRTAAVLALLAEGKGKNVIAHELGLTPSTVSALICSSNRGKTGGTDPAPKADSAKSGRPVEAVAINEDIKRELRPHAKRRDLSVLSLAQLILETVVESGLVDAVLDDRGDA